MVLASLMTFMTMVANEGHSVLLTCAARVQTQIDVSLSLVPREITHIYDPLEPIPPYIKF